MKLRNLLPLMILCFVLFPVFSQETENPEPVFVISSIEFNIEGFTRPNALIDKGKFFIGEEITGYLNLEKYIQEKTQLLFNERVLESVSIDYITGEKEDENIPVSLVINVKDTWNIVAIPRPRYRSGSGFDFILKARDYNFLGTMSPLRLDIGYIYDENKQSSFLFELDSNIPLWAFGFKWNFRFLNAFDYRFDNELPNSYKNITGLSVELPVKFTTITFGFDESFLLNEENDNFDKLLYGNFQDGFYMSSRPFIAWEIPTGLVIGKYGDLVYTPELSAVFNHEFSKWPLDEIRKGPFLNFGHNLGFERIDWIGNFQKGLDVSIDNSFGYDFYRSSIDEQALVSFLGFSGIGHFTITDFFGISTRLMYRHWFLREGEYKEAGDTLRGILGKNVCTDYMLSLNLDFPFRVLRFTPSKQFNNPKWRIFNFDLHLSPIIDTALYHDPVNEIEFSFKNILVTGGLEAIVFPEFFRSLYLRISLGWDLTSFSNGRNWELFIGTEFHY